MREHIHPKAFRESSNNNDACYGIIQISRVARWRRQPRERCRKQYPPTQSSHAKAAMLLCDHPDINVVTFVGTSSIARKISQACNMTNKRCLALGGAKNHMIAARDCHLDMTSQDVVNSFTGCAGQRCMAASVLLVIGEQPNLIDMICEKARGIVCGQTGGKEMGPVIDKASLDRITQ